MWNYLLALPLGMLMAGCSGPSPSAPPETSADPGAATGALTVHLVRDGLAPGLAHLNLVIRGLEIQVDGHWRAVPLDGLGAGAAAIPPTDVLALDSGNPGTLATAVPWPEGLGEALRFSLGDGSTVQFTGEDEGTFHPLRVPEQFTAPMGLPGSFYVARRTTLELWITFEITRCVVPDPANPGSYLLRPGAVRGFDRAATGTLRGTLQGAAGALAGVPVTAQLMRLRDAQGAALAFRTALTDGSGRFTLDLLPLGYTWVAVSQPTADGTVYGLETSPGTPLGRPPFDSAESRLDCTAVPVTGAVTGTISAGPAPDQQDAVDLVQDVALGGVPCSFVVRSVLAGPTGTFSFPALPPGRYSLVLNRYSRSLAMGLMDQRFATAQFQVAAGATASIRF